MSCGCNDTNSFKLFINKAKEAEQRTREPYIVYIRIVKGKEHFFTRPMSELNKIEGITEYFLSDETKKVYVKKKESKVKEVKKPFKPSEEKLDKK